MNVRTRRRHTWIFWAGATALLGVLCFIKWDLSILHQEAPANQEVARKARADYYQRMLRDPATGEIPPGIRKRELAHAATLPDRRLTKAQKTGGPNIMWMEAGPNDIGGRTRALAVDRTNSNTVLAGGVAGGIWKSTDRGNSWELKSDPSLLTTITYLAQDPRPGQTSTWYAVTGESQQSNWDRGRKAAPYGEGFYTSTDSGESWTLLESADDPTLLDSPFDFGLKVLVSPTTGSIFTASQFFGIQRFKTPEAEREWLLGQESLPEWADFDIATDGSIIAVTSAGFNAGTSEAPGVFYSTDDGDTWLDITPTAYDETPERSVIAFAPSDPDRAYLWTFTGETTQNSISAFGEDENMQFFALSLPDGISEDRSSFLPMFGGGFGNLYTQNSYDMVIAVNPMDPNDVFIGGTNLYRSKNGFSTPLTMSDIARTWVGGYAITNNDDLYTDHHPDQHALFFDPQEEGVLWSGHDGGLSLALNLDSTSNAIDWRDKNNGYNVTQFYHISMTSEAGDERLIGGTQDNGTPYLVFDPTAPTGSSSISDLSRGDGAYTYLGTRYGLSSTTFGRMFELRYNEFTGSILRGNTLPINPQGATNQLFINPFTVDKVNESVVYYPGGQDLWRSSNIPGNPESWSRLSNSSVPSGYRISALQTGIRSVDGIPVSVLYFAASRPGATPIIYRLDEASTTTEAPVSITILDLPPDAYIHHIAVNPLDGNELMVIASNYNITGLYHSTDGGTSFTPVEGNLTGTEELPGPSLRAATMLPVGNATLYIVGTSSGVYSTTFLSGNNTEWVKEAVAELGNTIVESIASRQSDQRIALGTHGRGIFIGMPLPAVSIDTPRPTPDAGIKLGQNYPNPFSATTTFSFTLEFPGLVSFRVFDATGRRVKTIIRQNLHGPGTHSLPFNSGTLPNGMYIYELEVRPLHSANQVIRESKVMALRR